MMQRGEKGAEEAVEEDAEGEVKRLEAGLNAGKAFSFRGGDLLVVEVGGDGVPVPRVPRTFPKFSSQAPV